MHTLRCHSISAALYQRLPATCKRADDTTQTDQLKRVHVESCNTDDFIIFMKCVISPQTHATIVSVMMGASCNSSGGRGCVIWRRTFAGLRPRWISVELWTDCKSLWICEKAIIISYYIYICISYSIRIMNCLWFCLHFMNCNPLSFWWRQAVACAPPKRLKPWRYRACTRACRLNVPLLLSESWIFGGFLYNDIWIYDIYI
jgi:hypothetical protein